MPGGGDLATDKKEQGAQFEGVTALSHQVRADLQFPRTRRTGDKWA